MDVVETDREIKVSTELPGLDDKDIDMADAVFRKGVLTVTLPKTGRAEARKRITVKT